MHRELLWRRVPTQQHLPRFGGIGIAFEQSPGISFLVTGSRMCLQAPSMQVRYGACNNAKTKQSTSHTERLQRTPAFFADQPELFTIGVSDLAFEQLFTKFDGARCKLQSMICGPNRM